MPIRLDDIDRRILRVLQAEGRIPNSELAERVGLSATPCLRRVRALEEAGVITGYRADLDRTRIGLGLTVLVGVKVDGHRDENARAIQEALQAMPEVVSCHLVSGETDFLLQVVVPDLAAYERFLLGTLLKLPMVKDIRSNIVIRTVKENAPLPLG
ncbi:Lrp/AsnC family transcriptional regulator [Rhodoplanes sp. TEM]|uniref:Lrp/AsnC family transcriptional regulator n=1 Tax=Rhodoplanes tepidamans TaxID=200616 RepID=A0ABT5J724_RHOTP|nr:MULTISPECIES: Lrp/AsnC family transcriptional regulator [Rhodoplanes]MDC7785440.1 Lrp/AsnC family transcriptional regulator [Rhodoplanes tepidamans]MDC7985779.1 Lrp/AsnC family transcriptional regulator [Rhodoplanes sp. TEM]MDQ0353106.1 Lrp/AsnC family leucine-responsive transcriptional regulator [Rhodoplanes tepidamans]